MRIISHRGNISGPNKNLENNPKEIDLRINENYDVEIDLRVKGDELFLGHDLPVNPISLDWLVDRKDFLWIHCKDFLSLNYLSKQNFPLNYFWHETDKYVLTSKGFLWTYPGNELQSKCIHVMPEWDDPEFKKIQSISCYAICTDYPKKAKEIIAKRG